MQVLGFELQKFRIFLKKNSTSEVNRVDVMFKDRPFAGKMKFPGSLGSYQDKKKGKLTLCHLLHSSAYILR